MQFANEFSVNSSIDRVWDTLLNVEEVAPCMPGAEVLEQIGDNSYKVSVKVRLGPVSMQYRGDVEIVDADASAHAAKLVAKATEARGQGTANAEIAMKLAERNGGTHATLTTDLRLSGRAAAMGQGIVKDVAGKLTEAFAECLAGKLEGAPAPAAVGEGGTGWSPTSGETDVSERETAPAPEAAAAAATAATRPHAVASAPDAGAAAASGEAPGAPFARSARAPSDVADVPGALEREDVPAPRDKEPADQGLPSRPEVPSAPPEQEEPAARSPEVAAELPALEIGASVIADRLRKPRVLVGAVAVVFALGFVAGRLARG
jgi:carbon monoxide dehydrogenase subunit G